MIRIDDPGAEVGEEGDQEVEKSKNQLSSSSVDPGSSSNANTNSRWVVFIKQYSITQTFQMFMFSAAPSSDGSLLKNQWPSQSELHLQIEDKSREIERLKTSLGEAEAKLEAVEARISDLVGLSREGLRSVREELGSVRTKVDTDRTDILASMADMAKQMMDSLQELETLSQLPGDLEKEKSRRRESETELEELRSKLETELHKLDDCHKEIDIYRYQLEEANRSLDAAKEDMDELRTSKEEEFVKMKQELEGRIRELTDTFKTEKRELKQALELEHELELDNFKEKVNKTESDQVSSLLESIGDLKQKLKSKDQEIEEKLEQKDKDIEVQLERKQRELDELLRSRESSSESVKSDRTEILEAEFQETLANELAKTEQRLRSDHKRELEELKEAKNEEMLERMEEVRQKMLDSSQLSVERMQTKLERQQLSRIQEREEELRAAFACQLSMMEDAKTAEIEEVKEKVRKKSKMEIETLRSRFKIMQATGGMERSPSVSESEFPLEVG